MPAAWRDDGNMHGRLRAAVGDQSTTVKDPLAQFRVSLLSVSHLRTKLNSGTQPIEPTWPNRVHKHGAV